MRIVTVVLPVLLLALAGCVSRAGPPPDATLPTRGPVPGECAATDLEVTADTDENPVVTVPTGCAPPTTALARDLATGHGARAARGSDVEVAYAMIAWTSGVVVETTWSGNTSSSVRVTDLGDAGWQQGLLGMREGGRRVFVDPPDENPTETNASETVIYVLDVLRVS